MATSHFSPFELLLLKSRNQTDTAALLLLAWVMASKGNVLPEDKRYLEGLADGCRHGHALQPLIDIADAQDLAAIQLAAEVLQKDWRNEQSLPFLRRAVGLATSNGPLAANNQHVLRFLADLLGVAPADFARLFQEVVGRPLGTPEDPSRADYWQAREHTRQQRSHSQQQQHEQQQYSWRHQRGHDDKTRHDERHEHRSSHHWQPPPSARSLRALRVLGLDEQATRHDIKKAYRRLAQVHHPDRFHTLGERRMATASQRFQRIKDAYEYLMQDARFV